MRLLMASLLVLVAGCPADPAGPDAPAGPIDAAVDGGDGGMCGGEVFFTGEYVDLDSTPASFLGVAGAVWTVAAAPARTDTTAPNGRVELCLPATGRHRLTVQAPGNYLDGYFDADSAVFADGRIFSARGILGARAEELYSSLGFTFDPLAAHLLVEVQGGQGVVDLTGVSVGGTAAFDGTDWAVGDVGSYVLFANVTAGIAALNSSGATGLGPIELVGGAWHMTTIVRP